MSTEEEKIRKLKATIEMMESLPEDMQDADYLSRLRAEVKGLVENSVIAQGEGNIAAGEGAVVVQGDMDGPLTVGENNTINYTKMTIGQIVAQVVDPSGPDEEILRATYLAQLLKQCDQLTLGGIDPKAVTERSSRLSLAAVYTTLMTTRSTHRHGTVGHELGKLMKIRWDGLGGGRPLSAIEHLNEDQYLVLLGDPGSGKSTFVNFVTFCLAGEALGDGSVNLQLMTVPLPEEIARAQEEEREPEAQPWTHRALLPVRIILRDLAARGLPDPSEEATAVHLWTFLEAELARMTLGEYIPHLQKELREGGGLILFDGLDEVPAADSRRSQIINLIQLIRSGFPKCRIVVTSRTYAYADPAWQLDGFAAALLASFTSGQIERFITRWYAHVAELRQEDQDDFAGRATQLVQTISSNSRLQELAERPILLTLMASLHAWRGGSLPENREELYADAVDLLLELWEQKVRILDPSGQIMTSQPSLESWLQADRKGIRQLINRLAFEAHSGQADLVGTADIPETDLVMGLLELSRKANASTDPDTLIRYLSERAGLLLPRGQRVYTFPHRTFQEYLAASHLTDQGDAPQQIAQLVTSDPNRWREVALLAAAKLARGGAFALWPIINELCPEPYSTEGENAESVWGAHLAGQAIAEIADLEIASNSRANAASIERVRHWLVGLLRTTHLPANERMGIGRHLAILGDPRPEVMQVDEMQLCWVNPGPFTMGSDSDDLPFTESEWRPAHTQPSPYPYWIGRFPVTENQYQAFISDNGYENENWWQEALNLGIWTNSKVRTNTFNQLTRKGEWETRARHANYGSPFSNPNHPVVGVSWFEALAFTRWLTARWRNNQLIPQNWEITLPNEPEWEKAARGGHEFPKTPLINIISEISPYLTHSAGSPINNKFFAELKINPDPERLYPWFDSPEVSDEHANYSSDSNSSSAVGLYTHGISPVGCEEMGGNVGEWTRSIHGRWDLATRKYKVEFTYPYTANDGREDLFQDRHYCRTIKMGYWGSQSSWATCVTRGYDVPNADINYFGFRIVLVPVERSGL